MPRGYNFHGASFIAVTINYSQTHEKFNVNTYFYIACKKEIPASNNILIRTNPVRTMLYISFMIAAGTGHKLAQNENPLKIRQYETPFTLRKN